MVEGLVGKNICYVNIYFLFQKTTTAQKPVTNMV